MPDFFSEAAPFRLIISVQPPDHFVGLMWERRQKQIRFLQEQNREAEIALLLKNGIKRNGMVHLTAMRKQNEKKPLTINEQLYAVCQIIAVGAFVMLNEGIARFQMLFLFIGK